MESFSSMPLHLCSPFSLVARCPGISIALALVPVLLLSVDVVSAQGVPLDWLSGTTGTVPGSLDAYAKAMCALGSLRADASGLSGARAVNADGSIIVGRAETEDGYARAFRWDGANGGNLRWYDSTADRPFYLNFIILGQSQFRVGGDGHVEGRLVGSYRWGIDKDHWTPQQTNRRTPVVRS